MATLTGNAIKNSYLGLLKTTDNAIVGASEKEITDGAGNAIPMTVGTNGVSFTGDADFTGATVTGLPDNDTTYSISADGGTTGTAGIILTGSDTSSSSVSLIQGTNITLTQSGDTITIDAAGGGGGSETSGAVISALPIIAGGAFAANQGMHKTWVATTGYALVQQVNPVSATEANWAVFGMEVGETIEEIVLHVNTAGTVGAGKVGIYSVEKNASGYLTIADLLQDCGTFDSTTTGKKTITLASTFTMPAGNDYNAIAIVVGGDATADAFRMSGHQQAIWNGNSALIAGTTAYRTMSQRLVSWDGTHKNYLTGLYRGDTNAPLWVYIK